MFNAADVTAQASRQPSAVHSSDLAPFAHLQPPPSSQQSVPLASNAAEARASSGLDAAAMSIRSHRSKPSASRTCGLGTSPSTSSSSAAVPLAATSARQVSSTQPAACTPSAEQQGPFSQHGQSASAASTHRRASATASGNLASVQGTDLEPIASSDDDERRSTVLVHAHDHALVTADNAWQLPSSAHPDLASRSPSTRSSQPVGTFHSRPQHEVQHPVVQVCWC